MSVFKVQFLKELKTYFNNFNAYIVFLSYYILSSFAAIYFGELFLRETNILDAFFIMQPMIMIFIIPAITMRSWADEIKSGTIEILLTQPISYFSLVFAKFLAAFVFFLLLSSSSLFLLFFISKFSIIDVEATISGYTGLFLTGALFCAIGNLVSAFNKNVILSYIITIFILFIFTQFSFSNIGNVDLNMLNFESNYTAFLDNVLYINNVTYFVIGISLCLWLNLVVVNRRKSSSKKDKYLFYYFVGATITLFILFNISVALNFDKYFDFSSDNRYSLSEKSKKILDNTKKRIDVTLYEAFAQRSEPNSRYSIFAKYIETTLKLIENYSDGAIKPNIVYVDPFSKTEQKLIRDGTIYSEDKLGRKSYLVMDFSDNEGNNVVIKGFNDRKSNFVETDIIRIVNTFGLEKKKIAVFANNNVLRNMLAFKNAINEFYDVKYFDFSPVFIPNTYDLVVVLDIEEKSSETLLAMEQYILNGGNLILFGENDFIASKRGKHWIEFLNNFGITPNTSLEVITNEINGDQTPLGLAKVVDHEISDGIRSVVINGASSLSSLTNDNYKTTPVLMFADKIIAMTSKGIFPSNHIDMADNSSILPISSKEGSFTFIYDKDLIQDYLLVENEKENTGFYDTFYSSDNMLFILRLLDVASKNNKETSIEYKVFNANVGSIGNAVLKTVQKIKQKRLDELQENLNKYTKKKENFYSLLNTKGFASVKNIGDINKIEQAIEEAQNELNKEKSLINNKYLDTISVFTVVIIFGMPLIFLFLMFLSITIAQIINKRKIRRLMSNE